MPTIPQLAPEALAQRYALLCESTRPEPDEHMLAYSVEQGLQALDKLLTHNLRTLARQGAPDDFADIQQALEREMERLREFCAFPALANKLVVAFGGGFSAGKSSLINALLGRKLMVTEVDPTTSLPTYVLCGECDEVSALNLFGHRVALSEDAFLSLTHDEPLLYGSHISRLLRAAFMTRADFPWQQLALIDTPGYSKDQSNSPSGTHSERTDEHIARAQLNAAQAVVWVIDARQGCITEDDLAFLGSLQRSIPLFIALSRADQKPEADIPGILSVVSTALKGRGIPVVGMAAFSARKTRAWPLEPLLQQFRQWNEQAAQPQLAHSFQAGFARYDQFLAQQHTEAHDELNRLNRILALSDHSEAQAEATHLKARSQTRLQALKEQDQQLEALWQTFGTQLGRLGQQVGMALPAHGVLRKVEVPVPQPAKAAPAVTVAKSGPQPGDILCAGSGFPELVVLPGGSFQMGNEQNPHDHHFHSVRMQSFAMGKHPVTQAQWRKVMDSNPSNFRGNEQQPVVNVSWDEIQVFIKKLNRQTAYNYRLPSEAEWEYACRAGSTGQWCFGDDQSQLKHYAWYNDNSDYKTHPVGEKKANAFDLYDMHGNVWEWCEDQWHSNYKGAPSDGSEWVDGGNSNRVFRGGSRQGDFLDCRSYVRGYGYSDRGDLNIGFRLASTLPFPRSSLVKQPDVALTTPGVRPAATPLAMSVISASTVHTAKREPQPGDVLCDGDGLPELICLPGGSFQMGGTQEDDEQPVHTVRIASFAMGKYPVTQGQWKQVMGHNPSLFSNGGDQCPVEMVSWDDAQAFIQKLNQQTGHTYRLPSEAEWEYACRAGSTGQWCFGDDESQLKHYAWYDDNSGGETHPVGEKKANAFGLHDMHGNVWEWCEDRWHSNYQGAPSDGRAWINGGDSGRLLRGGSCSVIASLSRTAYRNGGDGFERYHKRQLRTADYNRYRYRDNFDGGFRVARTAP